MPETVRTHEYDSIESGSLFEISTAVLKALGLDIWKTRPIGGLIIANGTVSGKPIQATVTVRPARTTAATFSVRGDLADENELQDLADRFFGGIQTAIDQGN
jgi:hypothetical protein